MSNSNLWKLNLIKLRINFPSLPSLVTNSEWEAGYRYFENSNWYICSLFFLFWVKIILGNLGWFKHMHSFNFCAYYTCTNICIFNHQDRSCYWRWKSWLSTRPPLTPSIPMENGRGTSLLIGEGDKSSLLIWSLLSLQVQGVLITI